MEWGVCLSNTYCFFFVLDTLSYNHSPGLGKYLLETMLRGILGRGIIVYQYIHICIKCLKPRSRKQKKPENKTSKTEGAKATFV